VPTPTADAEGSAPCAGLAEELGWSLRSKQAAPMDRLPLLDTARCGFVASADHSPYFSLLPVSCRSALRCDANA
jgi:hypothetical protein